MRVDLSAVPKLVNSPPVPGAGSHRSETEWAEAIERLRPRFMGLCYGDLCNLMHLMEMGDLTGIVISRPFDADLLMKLKEGLSEAVGTILADDCAQYGECLLGADLACGTYTRTDAALSNIEARWATPDQLDQLRPLALQLAAFSEEDWYREARLPTDALYPLITLTGGLEGPFGQRVRVLSSPKTWEFFSEDYRDHSDEPVYRKVAEQALNGIPALLAGQAWPFDDKDEYLSAEEMDDWMDEMEKLLGLDNKTKESSK